MSSFKITIDGRKVEVQPGQTILEAARKLGVEIPTLCFLESCTPATSCLVCLVKLQVNGQGRMIPSCATLAQPGMVIESETSEVHEARRTALELLLSDHVGDCLSPCHRICPLRLDVPVMLRQIETGRLNQAAITVREALPLPSILGRLCHHPCEHGCRRGTWDQPAAIRDLEREAADLGLQPGADCLPRRKSRSGKSIAIIGAGPTGLSAAYDLIRQGHACTVVDRHDRAGGSLRTRVRPEELPPHILDAEIVALERLGIQFRLGVELGAMLTLEGLQRGFDCVLITVGELAPGEGTEYGVALSAAGIKVSADTYQTNVANVFAAGSAVKGIKQLVRAMAEGRAAAQAMHEFLHGHPPERKQKKFSSMMGRLEKDEVERFLPLANSGPRQFPCSGCADVPAQAPAEAARCLHCDCRAAGNCKLQEYAELYAAEPSRFREERRSFEQHLHHGDIIYEPGKCILCGICVQLAEKAREPLGLTFIGRGFDVRVAAPFGRTIAEGLQKVGAECVRNCPTGALVFRKNEV